MKPSSSPSCAAEGEAYARRINEGLGRELRRLREVLGLSAYQLGRGAGVSDQTVRNIEEGRCAQGAVVGTLARMAWRLGLRLEQLLAAAEPAETPNSFG